MHCGISHHRLPSLPLMPAAAPTTHVHCSVGDSEAQQAQLSAVTKEATAKALLITIKKLQARCAALRRAVLCSICMAALWARLI